MALRVPTSLVFMLAAVLVGSAPQADLDVKDFMLRFGYIDEDDGGAQALLANGTKAEEKFVQAIKLMQSFGGIPETGKIDSETIKLMSSRRCGVKDVIPNSKEFESFDDDEFTTEVTGTDTHVHHHHHHHHQHNHFNHSHGYHHNHNRKKRYIVASRLWPKRNLSYFVANWTPQLSRDDVVRTFERALETWGRYGRLQFTPAKDQDSADITFIFYSRDHGDPYPFDGRGGVLAHAYFPGSSLYEGHVHLDSDENWKIDLGKYDNGVDLFTVALHELGHTLGLSHSRHEDSIMNPYYKGSGWDLAYDDRRAMYELYATKELQEESRYHLIDYPKPTYKPTIRYPVRTTTTTTTTTSTTEGPERTTKRDRVVQETWSGPSIKRGCFGNFDTVALIRNELFIFKGKLLWRLLSPGRVQQNYPVKFYRMFPGLPENTKKLDAVYQRDHDSAIIFFIGRQFWVSDGRTFIEDSPKSIEYYGLPEEVEEVDAVTSSNNIVLLFSGGKYWTFDDLKKRPGKNLPRSVSDIRGLPPKIDAALTYNDGMTYFFKGDRFWEYDESREVLKEHSETASDYWLNC